METLIPPLEVCPNHEIFDELEFQKLARQSLVTGESDMQITFASVINSMSSVKKPDTIRAEPVRSRNVLNEGKEMFLL